jgi:MFS family permease
LAIPSYCGTILPAVLFGIGQGLNMPTLMTMLTELAPEENRAVFLSLNSMSLRLGQTLGPLIMGVVFSLFGIEAVFAFGAALALVMVALLCAFLGKSNIAS